MATYDPTDPIASITRGLEAAKACDVHPPIHVSRSIDEAQLWNETIARCGPMQAHDHLRYLARHDLFYLLVYILNRQHFLADRRPTGEWVPNPRKAQWCFDRCSEITADPDNHLDVWPREHYKSEIITFGLVIQDILNDPNEVIGIFSHNRPMARKFLFLIRTEFQNNQRLKDLFPDILFQDPERESPKWTMDGITVKRDTNRKEATIEAWGVVDGQPTSARFTKLHYDDVVGRDEIGSSDMIDKTTDEFDNSLFLTASDPPVVRYCATFQEIGDTTQQLMRRGWKVRLRHGLGGENGDEPLCLSPEKWAWFKTNLGAKPFALQLLLDPRRAVEDRDVGFKLDWVKDCWREADVKSMNRYILVDPAGAGPESNSWFFLWVVGACADRTFKVLDAVRDHLSLVQRGDVVFEMVRKWDPLLVAYETYAMQADVEHIRDKQDRENCRFRIFEVGGTRLRKDERIEKSMPLYSGRRIIFPAAGIKYRQKDGNEVDVVNLFLEREYSLWPFNPRERDGLDALARLEDEKLRSIINFPKPYGQRVAGAHWQIGGANDSGGWMAG